MHYTIQYYDVMRCIANLRTKIMDFRRFDSSRILNVPGGIPRSIGNLQESLSQAILVGIILVGRLGVALDCTVPISTIITIITIISIITIPSKTYYQ